LEKTLADLRSRIEENGVGEEDSEKINRLQVLLKQLQDKANLCASATGEWREFFSTAATIAVPKKQNQIGVR